MLYENDENMKLEICFGTSQYKSKRRAYNPHKPNAEKIDHKSSGESNHVVHDRELHQAINSKMPKKYSARLCYKKSSEDPSEFVPQD